MSWPPNDETFSKDDLVSGVLNRVYDVEATLDDAVEMAVDITLQYVVDWLHERGNMGPAAVLGDISGVDK